MSPADRLNRAFWARDPRIVSAHFSARQTRGAIDVQIFLSYASEQKAQAEAIAFSLRSRGHKVFLDEDDLPPGKSYNEQIEIAIANSDYLLFLISPDSIRPGRYTLTELEHARRKWRSPDGYILPVMVEPTDMSLVSKFLSAVTILEPKGNIAAEVAAHVKETDRNATRSLVAYFAAGGAISGFLSDELFNLPGMGLLYPLGGGISIYPGIYFRLALCSFIGSSGPPRLSRPRARDGADRLAGCRQQHGIYRA